ncbi:MAG: type VI secretion lipoprotein TssJ [Planctomycetaceae bacterium]|nr:type VI secretion lipoprotein TssJ [Planctomycetaceae bacterium]
MAAVRSILVTIPLVLTLSCLVGCVQYDQSYATPCPDEGGTERATALRIDQSDPARRHRIVNMAGDPRETPTPRDIREARGFVNAHLDLLSVEGLLAYRSDGSASDPKSAQFVAAKRALTIDYAASDALNVIDGTPHPLLLSVYHLKNRRELDKTLEAVGGVRTLLNGEEFSDEVMGMERFTIQPGESGQLVIDRPHDGKYVAIAAGYGDGRIFVGEYPLAEYSAGGTTTFSRSRRMFRPLPLKLYAEFRPDRMAVYHDDHIFDGLRGATRIQARQVRDIRTQELGRDIGVFNGEIR